MIPFPVLLARLVLSLLVTLFHAPTQINEMNFFFVPTLLAVI
ncbi:hypothetical protein GQX43_05530 [Staphylococcus aureus]|nr:hypothetical protein [Staphylococcus aureus]